MSFIDGMVDKVKGEAKYLLEKQKMKADAMDNLQDMASPPSELNYAATQTFVLDDLQDLGIDNYESFLKMANLSNSTLGKYGNMFGVDEAINKASSMINTGLSWVDTATGLLKSPGIFMKEVFKRELGTIPPSATDKSIGTKDPISNSVDLKNRIYNIVERCGYAQDKILSVGYSRNYVFTSRPVLASDSSGQYKSFVFFTRPNMNLITRTDEGLIKLVPELLNYDSMYHLVASDPKLYSELCRDGAGQSNLFRLLSNYVKEIPPVRLSETERPGIENMYGYSTPMAGLPEYHNVDASITFNDNYRGDVAKLIYAISEYRHNVSKRGYAMRPEYIKNKADDTLISMYVVTTNANMEIIGFGVFLNGVVSDIPTHFTQHKAEGFSKDELLDNFSVTIKFSTYYPHAPVYFNYFNNIFNFNPLDCVDLKGQQYNMVAPGRNQSFETSGNNTRSSLFGIDFGVKLDNAVNTVNGVIDKAQGYVDQYGKYVDSAKGLLEYADSYNTVKSLVMDGKVQHGSEYVESVKYQYKGNFEFLAKNPGVYSAASQNPLELGRTIWKLGFSF